MSSIINITCYTCTTEKDYNECKKVIEECGATISTYEIDTEEGTYIEATTEDEEIFLVKFRRTELYNSSNWYGE